MGGKRIGLFFGSFNPIHNGHLMVANFLAEFGELDQVWLVISPLNPLNNENELLADYHRRELLNRAIGDYPKFRVSTVEFNLPKPSYTIDTLAFLAEKYPENQFSLIMGSDLLTDFHRWKNYEEILAYYQILVYPRPDKGPLSIPNSSITHFEHQNHPSVKLVGSAPMIEISSSFIRKSIKLKKDIRFFMPDQVWQYIDEMHFYK